VGLAPFGADERREGVYAFAALLGDPMANHPDTAVVWDVRDRGGDNSAGVSHSTSSRAAGYHTDAGYLKTPPRFFLLYAMKAAACGGGESLVRDGRTVLRRLGETDTGQAAIEALSHILPRRVPAKFRPVADIAEDGFQYAPILAGVPLWRWARKNTRLGLEHSPTFASPELLQALATVDQELRDGPDELRTVLQTDAVILVNNHLALHGRTEFTDTSRHLLRIRCHEPIPGR
jgi:alpha-ketoglutarate-dependent taurine dioxygenase